MKGKNYQEEFSESYWAGYEEGLQAGRQDSISGSKRDLSAWKDPHDPFSRGYLVGYEIGLTEEMDKENTKAMARKNARADVEAGNPPHILASFSDDETYERSYWVTYGKFSKKVKSAK